MCRFPKAHEHGCTGKSKKGDNCHAENRALRDQSLARACTITTAALEKHSTPLVGEFLIYGIQIKPRDGDIPSGSLPIETGADAWKNKAVGEYRFEQGPGATLVFLNPGNGSKIATTNAAALNLLEPIFVRNQGCTPELHRMLQDVLLKIQDARVQQRMRSKL